MNEREIEWRDPPAKRLRWRDRLAPLIERPGEWAMVHRASTPGRAMTDTSALRHGRLITPPGKWEFTSDGVEVFARYVGPL
jgi:hypothetical protein